MRLGNKSAVQQCTNECEGKRGRDVGGDDDMLEVFEKGCHANGGGATIGNIPEVKMQI